MPGHVSPGIHRRVPTPWGGGGGRVQLTGACPRRSSPPRPQQPWWRSRTPPRRRVPAHSRGRGNPRGRASPHCRPRPAPVNHRSHPSDVTRSVKRLCEAFRGERRVRRVGGACCSSPRPRRRPPRGRGCPRGFGGSSHPLFGRRRGRVGGPSAPSDFSRRRRWSRAPCLCCLAADSVNSIGATGSVASGRHGFDTVQSSPEASVDLSLLTDSCRCRREVAGSAGRPIEDAAVFFAT